MSTAFNSYSPKDIAFARMLHNALEESEMETWIQNHRSEKPATGQGEISHRLIGRYINQVNHTGKPVRNMNESN